MRTEKEILQSFVELGCISIISIHKNDYYKDLVLSYKDGEFIEILSKARIIQTSEFKTINVEEFKLLHELFELWGLVGITWNVIKKFI